MSSQKRHGPSPTFRENIILWRTARKSRRDDDLQVDDEDPGSGPAIRELLRDQDVSRCSPFRVNVISYGYDDQELRDILAAEGLESWGPEVVGNQLSLKVAVDDGARAGRILAAAGIPANARG